MTVTLMLGIAGSIVVNVAFVRRRRLFVAVHVAQCIFYAALRAAERELLRTPFMSHSSD